MSGNSLVDRALRYELNCVFHVAYDPRVARSKRRTIILVLAILALAIYGADRYRSRIEAIVWHVRHGDSTTVGAYRIPVPRYWFVGQDSSGDAQLLNSRTGDGIWAKSRPWPLTMNLDLWVGLETRLKDPKFVTLVRRDLRVGGEPFGLFGKRLDNGLQIQSDSWLKRKLYVGRATRGNFFWRDA